MKEQMEQPQNAVSIPNPTALQLLITFLLAIISFFNFKKKSNNIQATAVATLKEKGVVVNNGTLIITSKAGARSPNPTVVLNTMLSGIVLGRVATSSNDGLVKLISQNITSSTLHKVSSRALTINNSELKVDSLVRANFESLELQLFTENMNRKTLLTITCQKIGSEILFNLTVLSSTVLSGVTAGKPSGVVVGMISGIIGVRDFKEGLSMLGLIQPTSQQKLLTMNTSEALTIEEVLESLSTEPNKAVSEPKIEEVVEAPLVETKVTLPKEISAKKEEKELAKAKETTKPQKTSNIQGFGLGMAVKGIMGVRGITLPFTPTSIKKSPVLQV